jgi:hypothetical protein
MLSFNENDTNPKETNPDRKIDSFCGFTPSCRRREHIEFWTSAIMDYVDTLFDHFINSTCSPYLRRPTSLYPMYFCDEVYSPILSFITNGRSWRVTKAPISGFISDFSVRVNLLKKSLSPIF